MALRIKKKPWGKSRKLTNEFQNFLFEYHFYFTEFGNSGHDFLVYILHADLLELSIPPFKLPW